MCVHMCVCLCILVGMCVYEHNMFMPLCVVVCVCVIACVCISVHVRPFEVWVSEFTICNAQLILSTCIYRGIEHLLKWAWLCHSSPSPSITGTQTQSFGRPSAGG